MTLTKTQIAQAIQDRLALPADHASFLINGVLELMKGTLESGEDIMLSGFGKFQVRDKKNRRGRNPQTGNHLTLNARRVVTFKCSDVLKRKLNGG